MITTQGGIAPLPAAGMRPLRDITEAFEAVRQGLPALRDTLAREPDHAAATQALSRDIKLTLTALVTDGRRGPTTADEAFRLALSVAAAAANLGALDGAVTYVGRMLPLRVTDDESLAPPARQVLGTLESTGDEVLMGAEHVCRAEGKEHVATMGRVTRSIAARQLDELRAGFERTADVGAWQRSTVELMMTAYTAGILDACEVCVSP